MSPSIIYTFPGNHPHWTVVIAAAAGTVVAAALIASVVWLLKALGPSTRVRIGANWTWEETTADPAYMKMHLNMNVVSISNAPRLVVHSICVRKLAIVLAFFGFALPLESAKFSSPFSLDFA